MKPAPAAEGVAPTRVQPLKNEMARPIEKVPDPPKRNDNPPAGKLAAPAPPPKAGSIAAVKESTVYIRCTHLRGQMSSGSGFFAGKPGFVVTNAHVIGQMPRDVPLKERLPPVQKIEVVVNTGQGKPQERT